MTEKRFKADNYYFEIWDNDGILLSFDQTVNLLNQLNDENEQLKQQLANVDKLIDSKIKEYQKYDGYDTEKYYIGTQLLKELKKEFGDVK